MLRKKLRSQIVEPAERSLGHDGEEADKQHILKEVAFRFVFPFIYVDGVAHAGEGIVGNTQRSHQPQLVQGRNADRSEDEIDVVNQEVAVFQHDKDTDVDHQEKDQNFSFLSLFRSLGLLLFILT